MHWLTIAAFAAGLLLAFVLLALRGKATADIDTTWSSLMPVPSEAPEAFDPDAIKDLPAVAQRYLRHAIAPGTPLADAVVLRMQGSLRTTPKGGWSRLEADELLAAPTGFVWRARLGRGLGRIEGVDWLAHGQGGMRLWVLGLLPAVNRTNDEDFRRSAAGRMMVESVMLPTAFLPRHGAAWEAAGDDTARVTLVVDGEPCTLTLRVSESGALREISTERWGNQTPNGAYAMIPYGVTIDEEATFDGYTVPVRMRGGWGFGSGDYFEFFRPEVAHARYV